MREMLVCGFTIVQARVERVYQLYRTDRGAVPTPRTPVLIDEAGLLIDPYGKIPGFTGYAAYLGEGE